MNQKYTWNIEVRMDDLGNPCGLNITDTNGNIVCRLPDGATSIHSHTFTNQSTNAQLIALAPRLMREVFMHKGTIGAVFDQELWELVERLYFMFDLKRGG